jgi:protein-tyrosine phosphatase
MAVARKSVLFVCLGNICRSPACEGVARALVNASVRVASAGIAVVVPGKSADWRSHSICLENNINISEHKTRKMARTDWTNFSVIAGLDPIVMTTLTRWRPPTATAKLVLFNAPNGVDDPYFGDYDAFREMFQVIHHEMPRFLRENALHFL